MVLDRELVALAAADARCRLVRARIAERVVTLRAWRTLGFVRLSDFARERLGLSPRSLEEDARLVRALTALPVLRCAVESGELSWTRARILVRTATPNREGEMLETARAVPLRNLEDWAQNWTKAGRQPPSTAIPESTTTVVDQSGDDPLLRRTIELSRSGRRLWRTACEYASRSAGTPLSPGQVLELVVAETAGALPMAPPKPEAESVPERSGAHRASSAHSAPPQFHEQRLRTAMRTGEARGRRGLLHFLAEYGAAEGFEWLAPTSRDPGPARAVVALLEDIEWADAFELERRLQSLRLLTQRLEAQMAALLRVGIDRRLFHELGFATVPLYAEARLGICRRRVWSLVAIERHSWRTSRQLHAAWRDGKLTLLQATTLIEVVGEKNAEAWIARAREITLRRLQDEVAWALDHGDRTSHDDNPLPPTVDVDVRKDGLADFTESEVQKRAHEPAPHWSIGVPGKVHIDVFVPLSVAVLLETTLDRLQGWGEGRWHAFERMVAMALLEWMGAPKHRDPIFERDGWRCTVPGCSSRRNLHDHHVVFRSRGGGNALDNRITVCAAHHLHGLHAGIVRAWGTAPRGIVWELGCAPGREPLMRLLGDRLLHEE